MRRLTRPTLVLECEDFAVLGWDTCADPSRGGCCCAGCHYEVDDLAPVNYPLTRLFPETNHHYPSRIEARVCCSLRNWLESEGYLGEQWLPAAGPVDFGAGQKPAKDVRVYLDTRTIERDVIARLVRAARRHAHIPRAPGARR